MGPHRQRNLAEIIELSSPVEVVDVGANPIDGVPPYKGLLDAGHVRLVGFEPQGEALAKLNASKGPRETYLPDAVGDGGSRRFYVCRAPGMSSTLAPNQELLRHFHGFPKWAEVVEERELETVRLDDIAEIADMDFLKIDVQGGEMAVFQGGRKRLSDAVAVQTEVSFLPLYVGEPLFGEVDRELRSLGFMLHTFAALDKRAVAPLVVDNSIYKGVNQFFQADAVYIKDFAHIARLSSEKLKSLSMIMHHCYRSVDVAQFALRVHDEKFATQYWREYMAMLGAGQP